MTTVEFPAGDGTPLRGDLARPEGLAGWCGVSTAPQGEVDLGTWGAAKLLVHGSRDEVVPLDRIERLAASSADPKRLVVVDGGDHFLAAHGDLLTEELGRFGRELVA